MLRKVSVALSITLGFGILSSINVASAVVVDPSTKSCLDKTVGAKAANKIVSAKKLTKAQTAQVAKCKRSSSSTGSTG